MRKYYEDKKYLKIVDDILDNKEFSKLGEVSHHGIDRLDHSIRVSYNSYKISKFLGLDYKSAARAGLLHDFFFDDNLQLNKKERLKVLVKHPECAYLNSKKIFDISEKEKDIITTHMFPIGKKVPKYAESWLVDIVDDISSIYEKTKISYRYLSVALSYILLVTLNNL